jgi:hypothetical protein
VKDQLGHASIQITDRLPLLQQQRRERVSQVVNADLADLCFLQHSADPSWLDMSTRRWCDFVDTYGHLIPGANRAAVDRLDDRAARGADCGGGA